MSAPFHAQSSRIVYENRWMRVREDVFAGPNGARGIYGVVEKVNFAIIIAREGDAVWLVEQFRYPVGARFWELPQGALEREPHIPPDEVAKRELREETGLEAASWTRVGSFYQGYGFSTQRGHVFLAAGLTQHEVAREETERDMICRKFPIARVVEMACDGTIADASTIAALGLARMRGMV